MLPPGKSEIIFSINRKIRLQVQFNQPLCHWTLQVYWLNDV